MFQYNSELNTIKNTNFILKNGIDLKCIDAKNLKYITLKFMDPKLVALGTFGRVFRISIGQMGTYCAVKKILVNPLFRFRELEISRNLDHINICKVIAYCHRFEHIEEIECNYIHNELTPGDKTNLKSANPENNSGMSNKTSDTYSDLLYIIMEYVPNTIEDFILFNRYNHSYNEYKIDIDMVVGVIKQIFCGLKYLHSLEICHRDIKPSNILFDARTGLIKIADFGSAKIINQDGPNKTYICSRIYRAPEIIIGESEYTCKIDIWSAGCVLVEFITGYQLFEYLCPKIHLNSIANVIELFLNKGEHLPLPIKTRIINTTTEKPANILRQKCFPDFFNVLKSIFIYPHVRRSSATEIIELTPFKSISHKECVDNTLRCLSTARLL